VYIVEVKFPRDILKYEEALFFGLSLRQFLFSLIAVGVAVGAYLLCSPHLATETTSWICIATALPFAFLGFVHYNNMTADQFVRTWARSELLFPKVLIYQGTNLYMDAIEQERIEAARPKRKPLIKRSGKKKAERQAEKRRREKDFERRGRNIYKFRKRGRSR
jgi:hypothetical protein